MFDEREPRVTDPKTGISLRFVKEWDLVSSAEPVYDVWIPASWLYPLSGHKGDCLKVQTAQFQGVLTGRCTCGAES